MIGGSGAGMGPRGALRSFASENDGISFDPRIARRLLGFLKPYWKSMAVAVVCMIVGSALNLLAPYLLKVLIDTHIAGRDIAGILRISMILAGAYVTLYLVTTAQQYILSYTGQKVLRDLRNRLFFHLQQMHVGYHDTHLVGVTVSRVMNDVAVINELISQGLVTVAGDFLRLVGIIAIMLSMSPRLALYAFTVMPLMVLATYLFSRKAKPAYRQTRRSVAQVVGGLAEDISGMRVIQAFSQEERAREEFDGKNSENRDAHVRAMSLSFVFLPAVEFLGMLATAVVLWFGGHAVAAGTVSLGIVIAFLSYVSQFFQPIRELSQLYSTMQSAMAGGEQIFRLLDTESAVKDRPKAPDMPPILGRIELDHVRLSYTENVEVLHDISLTVHPGTMVAFVGPTGAGKTSVANVIGRFYELSGGAVRIDGTDIRAVTQHSLHSQMALVAQDPFLFAGSLRENITFGKPDATDDEVINAATRARAHQFISGLPGGYVTEIREGAVNLSLGQRQLVSIARAILADPRILVMDEATSNVDTLTESLIQKGLQELFANRTSIVIAHRLSTVLHADRIFVIDEGRVVEQGTHDELV
ncbi:MAG: ABC transporter ATP-binding protein, partial [Spirochaetaceae bacterium]|nr:ABC transporter ATP-binding protein [Spirochaetaceae bacterium]